MDLRRKEDEMNDMRFPYCYGQQGADRSTAAPQLPPLLSVQAAARAEGVASRGGRLKSLLLRERCGSLEGELVLKGKWQGNGGRKTGSLNYLLKNNI